MVSAWNSVPEGAAFLLCFLFLLHQPSGERITKSLLRELECPRREADGAP